MADRHLTRRILVPLDGSDLGSVTIPHLRALATSGSEIALLRVMPDPEPVADVAPDAAATYAEARRQSEISCHASLREIATELRDVSPYLDAVTRVGAPADEIIRLATERHSDLILMATHDRAPGERTSLDSVAHRVAQAAPVPVMMIHEHDLTERVPADGDVARYHRVVVPLDGSDRAREALPTAVALAKHAAAPVLLIRSVPTREAMFACGEEVMIGEGEERDEWYDAWRRALDHELDAEAHRLRASGIAVDTELLTGPAADAVLAVVNPGDVLVMASHGAGGVRSWLLGSVTQKVASLAASPVVVVPVADRSEMLRALPAAATTAT